MVTAPVTTLNKTLSTVDLNALMLPKKPDKDSPAPTLYVLATDFLEQARQLFGDDKQQQKLNQAEQQIKDYPIKQAGEHAHRFAKVLAKIWLTNANYSPIADHNDYVNRMDKWKHLPLLPNLIPIKQFYENIRKHTTPAQWRYIARTFYQQANYQCQLCGGTSKMHAVEAHEEWFYDFATGGQYFGAMLVLCDKCHECKHLGYKWDAELKQADNNHSIAIKQMDKLLEHLIKVNGLGDHTDAKQIISQMVADHLAIWAYRSSFEWQLNIQDWITWANDNLPDPESLDCHLPRPEIPLLFS